MIKNTGIKRKVDELGRIVIPMEIRKQFNIEIQDELEIFIDRNFIMLKKYEPRCIFCGNEKGVIEFSERLICNKCLEKLQMVNK